MRKSKPVLSNAAKVREALALIERLEPQIEQAIKMSAAAWMQIGQALSDQSKLMPSTRAFGQWIRDNEFNTGLLQSASVRANAKWAWENRDELQACKPPLTGRHPTEVRRQFLARQKSQERESRIFLDGLPREINWPTETIHTAAGIVVYVAHRIMREALITSDDVESLKANLVEVNAAADKLLRYVADHPEVLSAEPHKLE